MNETTTAAELSVLPDLAAEILCEACEADPARWAMVHHPCGHQLAVCEQCHDTARRLEYKLPADDERVYGCDRCDKLVMSLSWRRL